MRWSAERAIVAGFTTALLLLVIVGILSYRNTKKMREATDFVQHTRGILDDTRELVSQMKDIETAGRGFAIVGDRQFLRPFVAAEPRVQVILARLNAEIQDPLNRQLLSELTPVVQKKIEATRSLIARRESGMLPAELVDDLQVGRDLMDHIRETAGRMEMREFQLLQERALQADESERQVAYILQVGSISAVLFLSLALFVIFRDLRERNRIEAALRNAEHRFRALIQGSSDIVLMLAPTGEMLFVSPAVERILGYRSQDVQGKNVFSYIHPDDQHLAQDAFRNTLTVPGFAVPLQLRLRGPDSSYRWVEILANNLMSDPGLKAVVINARDVTERLELERLKDEFVSVVSHELRTPLTSIRGALGLLASGKIGDFPDKAQRMLEIAVNNSDRLVRLINDILDLERMESGRVSMHKRAVAIGDVMLQAADLMRAMAEKSNVRLDVHPVELELHADPDRMMQTFSNLLSNAIKFSPEGGTVRFTGEVKPNSVIVAVQDEGRGIPAEKLQSIFERFQQVDVSDSREKGGTGLGLAIVRMIVEQHGGKIWAESVLGQGSTFLVELPLATGESSAEAAS